MVLLSPFFFSPYKKVLLSSFAIKEANKVLNAIARETHACQ